MSGGREIFIAATPDDLAREAAARFLEAATRAIADSGRVSVALSGGSGPRKLFELLTQAPYRQALEWERVHVFFADERYVSEDHPDSNVRMARECLLNQVPVPAGQVHPMPTGAGSPEADAALYEASLRAFFGDAPPRFDLMLLGMGPDGHTASLFPGRPDQPGWVAAVHASPKPPPTRLTLTMDIIRQAKAIVFLVAGADKAPAVGEILGGVSESPATLPAGRARSAEGETLWLLDRAAAARLITADR